MISDNTYLLKDWNEASLKTVFFLNQELSLRKGWVGGGVSSISSGMVIYKLYLAFESLVPE